MPMQKHSFCFLSWNIFTRKCISFLTRNDSVFLAAILIVIGFKLVKINSIIRLFKTDWENGLVIVVTIVAVLLTDLLSGVGIGFVLAMIFLLRKNYELAFISHTDEKNTNCDFFCSNSIFLK